MSAENLDQELRDALVHLYDPDYEPSEALCELAGCDPAEGALALQSVIVQAIRGLEPPMDTPACSRVVQVYDLLHNRFVLKLTLEETAERMHMSFSTTWRAQRTAVHALARALREQRTELRQQLVQGSRADTQAANWRAQMERELAALQASAPDAVSDVGDVISGVEKLFASLTPGPDLHIEVRFVQPGLIAAVHPAVLRQVLIVAFRRLAEHTPAAPIAVYAGLEDGNVKITLTAEIRDATSLEADDWIEGLLLPGDATVEIAVDGSQVFLWLEVPSVGRLSVLVVDDNPDMARFYRRSTEGTRYRIVHAALGQGLFETVAEVGPDVVVLDVMLPDIDGWQLLMRLHEDPATRGIPVIVCTVIREEELALSLGAARYLAKPVRRREFIEALDSVLPQAGAEAPTQ